MNGFLIAALADLAILAAVVVFVVRVRQQKRRYQAERGKPIDFSRRRL